MQTRLGSNNFINPVKLIGKIVFIAALFASGYAQSVMCVIKRKKKGNMLKHLNSLPKRTSYWNLTNKILTQCSLSKIGSEKECLTAFANIRNSLHGNGIHKTNPLSIQIDGITFDFIKGKRV